MGCELGFVAQFVGRDLRFLHVQGLAGFGRALGCSASHFQLGGDRLPTCQFARRCAEQGHRSPQAANERVLHSIPQAPNFSLGLGEPRRSHANPPPQNVSPAVFDIMFGPDSGVKVSLCDRLGIDIRPKVLYPLLALHN